jgi:hypothetical protein
MEFAYVSFVTKHAPYPSLMREMIRSVLTFSKHTLIVYCIDFETEPFENNTQVIQRLVRSTDYPDIKHVFLWKPWIILNSLHNGLKSGQYIEADDLITPHADALKDMIDPIFTMSPVHPDQDTTLPSRHMSRLNVLTKTQPYVHAHVLFCESNRPFLFTWYENCKKTLDLQWAYDEAALNCTLWKSNARDRYLPTFDPNYKEFYNNPCVRDTAFMFHGCKDPADHATLLDDMIKHYLRRRVFL